MRLLNKRVVIVGGSRGIGRAIALKLAREGADIILTYCKDSDAAASVVEEIVALNRKGKAYMLDMRLPETFPAFVSQTCEFLGGCDVLINNAGMLSRHAFLEMPLEEFDNVLNANLRGPYFLSQVVANKMCDQATGGSIIHISSISDRVSTLGLTHYESSKAALSMLTKGMALELAAQNIRVNAVAPGLVATDINRKQWDPPTEIWYKRVSQIPLGRVGEPNDISGAVSFLASDEASWITGSVITVDGGRTII